MSTYADQVALRLAFTGDTGRAPQQAIAYLVTDAVPTPVSLVHQAIRRRAISMTQKPGKWNGQPRLDAASGRGASLPADVDT